MAETVLIVDDEEPVRRTFRDWLTQAGWGLTVVAMADAEAALKHAQSHPIDLAILDWNLGMGSDGLQLLEDLVEFHPDLVAIMVTGFAHQATPLDALRMGVRDYLDKNQELTRETFLASVRKQLDRIAPAKRQREFTDGLRQFRESVGKILPLVQSTAALHEPVPVPEAVKHLFRFLVRLTGAADGAMVARHIPEDGQERFLAFAPDGKALPTLAIPFGRSLAATVLSMGDVCQLMGEDLATLGPVDLQPFEAGHQALLAAPVVVADGTHVVIELFDKPGGFTPEDRLNLAGTSEFCTEILRHALAERQTQRLLINAVESALRVSETAVGTGQESDSLPEAVMDQLRTDLNRTSNRVADAETSLELAEAIRELAVRHGSSSVRHCLRLVADVRGMLDELSGEWNG